MSSQAPNKNKSKDQSNRLLARLIASEASNSPPESLLWIADEHQILSEDLDLLNSKPPPGKNSVHFISNRFDQYKLAAQAGLNAEFSDFSLKTNNSFKQVFFRVAKERALVHHVINQAFSVLPIGGKLWLAGHKNEGIKTHISQASSLFGSKAKVTKSKNQLSIAAITKAKELAEPLDDNEYTNLRQVPFEKDHHLWTKPGIYGWDKVDQGSSFLMQNFDEQFQHQSDISEMDVLDLGCGYGYISSSIAKSGPRSLIATDNCAAALQATEKNLAQLETTQTRATTKVLASDAGDSLTDSFDLILCNPPFHKGFALSDELHKKFLANTKRLLKLNGQAWYVVNQFLPIEKHCNDVSLSCKEVARNNSFKIFLMQH